ncbi:MAG: NADP-dependent phosphogluconate dehydrogenase, partial [Brevundimonas sp.]
MKIGVIGLGRMGANIARRLIRGGHEVVVHNRSPEPVQELAREGAIASTDFRDMRSRLGEKAIYWVMLPAGALTEETIDEIAGIARPGDILIDGGNSYYKDDIRRAKALRDKGLDYVDIGVSGGVWGLQRGYCMMIGGDAEVVRALDPIFETLAPGYGDIVRTTGRDAPDDRAEKGYIHAGPAGAGHFVKMVHNGIEYGLMQAYAEGFDILKNKMSERLPEDERFTLDLPDIAEVWRRGSVISSW